MSDQDYQAFLEYLFETYVRPRLCRVYQIMDRRMPDPLREQTRQTHEMLRFIERRCDWNGGPQHDFRPERLLDAIDETRKELTHAIFILREAGYLDAVDDHFCEIVAGMTMDHMPAEEIVVMKSLGSDEPDRDLRAVMYLLRARYSNPKYARRTVKTSLDRGVKELEQAVEDEKEDEAKSSEIQRIPRPRRWWKGCSQITTGCILSVANVGIALNAVDLPVSDETRTWGSIVSVATGVGRIMSGVGDLQGE